MASYYEYQMPLTFDEGNTYYLREDNAHDAPKYIEVKFLSYSASPAFMFVKNMVGITLYAPRDCLFERILIEK